MRVICISAKAGAGKDTFAAMVKKELEDAGYSVLTTHYADLVKDICKRFFGWNGKKDEYGRRLMQYVGTDVGRAYNENIWVDHIADMLTMFNGQWDFVLIPDTRFPNEIEVLKNRGLSVTSVRIHRPDFQTSLTPEQLLHPSECALDHYDFDALIINDGNEADLAEKALNFTRELFGHQISFDEYIN